MRSKILILVSLASTLALFPAVTSNNVQPLDIFDDALVILEDLKKIVDSTTISAQAQLSTIRRRVVETRSNYTTVTAERVEAGKEILSSQITSLAVLADALDVSICLEGRQEELAQITEELIDEIDRCLLHIEQEANTVVINVTIYLTQNQLYVDILNSTLEECRTQGVNAEYCVRVLIGEMQLAQDELPTTILDEVVNVLRLAESWQQGLSTCSDSRIGLIYSVGNRIVYEIENCIVTWGIDENK